ncbi:fungal-specific transcription factor domain-containing protein [Aspergillus novoparasiticus]|uniref:Fungal-specific transcription factor domain-containing protein n=1 Tax=Aspergillus novoparasiticus TaxID=986946 RepID=A0A5N6E740_9EURO|nr:fungal-specific transcription factor domain-containing protein [Aspergillus novoparasiticus]
MSILPYTLSTDEKTGVRCDLGSVPARRSTMVNTSDKAEGNDSEQLRGSHSFTSKKKVSLWFYHNISIRFHRSGFWLRNALISGYISWVHPFCPVIDMHTFLSSITYMDGSHGKISLLLLHSVMFAGASFAPLSELQKAGYNSRLAAKTDFYFRAKLLYDFGYESDMVVLVQSLLLMSYWHDARNSLQNQSHWIGLANTVARSIGLHQNPAVSMTAKDMGLWRRLGWTCFIRDRIISLDERHLPTIALRHFNLTLPEVSDFEICTLPPEILQAFPDCEVLQRPGSQVALAQIFIEKVKLCMILDGILGYKDEKVALNLGVMNEGTVVQLEEALQEQDVANVYQYKLSRGSQKYWCIRRFSDCTWYLRQLQDIHEYAAFAAECLVHASCKLCLPIRLLNDEQLSEFGVGEHACSLGHFPPRHPHEDSNVNMGIPNSVPAPPESIIPWPSTSPEFVQQMDSPFQQDEYGYGYGCNVDFMSGVYDTYHTMFSGPSDTLYPTELLDSLMAEPFRLFVNDYTS